MMSPRIPTASAARAALVLAQAHSRFWLARCHFQDSLVAQEAWLIVVFGLDRLGEELAALEFVEKPNVVH